MLAVESAVQLARVLLQTLVIYLCLVFGFVFLGRRSISQLTFLEMVVIMILGSSVETAMVAGDTSLPAGLVSATTLLVCNRLMAYLMKRWRWLRRLVVGQPILLIDNGHFIPHNLLRVGLTEEDVLAAIREHGYDDPTELQFAVLEIDGSVGVVPVEHGIYRHGRRVRPLQRRPDRL